jgi:hypothetical protein
MAGVHFKREIKNHDPIFAPGVLIFKIEDGKGYSVLV